MLESIEIIKDTFLEFKGTGAYITLYLLAMIYILLKEEKRENKTFFVYFQIILLIVILNPVFNKIVGKIFTESVYWRVYWTIPLGITIAYALVKLISEIDSKAKEIVAVIGVIGVIIISGKFIYTEENYTKVGNAYKLPDEHVLVAQLIGADEGEYKKALVPETLVAHIRQIDANIKLAYKRNPVGYANNEFVTTLLLGDTEKITKLARKNDCNYIVMKKETTITLYFHYFGYEQIGETTNYVIYKKVYNKS